MALSRCRDCGEQVSTAAAACPRCGRLIKRRGGVGTGCGVVAVALLVLFIIGVIANSGSKTPASSPSSAAAIPTSGATQEGSAPAPGWGKEKDPTWLKTKAGRLWKKHPGWVPEICETIVRREVIIGMTDDQVRAAWGRPDQVNVTIRANTRHEQWVWGDRQYAYFDDGILRSIQQSH